jgi:serine/threonine protein kinase
MLRDVAAGMHYLHTRKPAVVHGDLRSPNLLLDLTIDSERPRYHVKIADFGLARWVVWWLTWSSIIIGNQL